MTSIRASPVVPRCVAYLFPLVLIASCGIFAYCNQRVGTSIEGTVRVGTYRTPRLNVFEFSLWTSVRDMWEAEAYFLAVLIAGWSGAWPYVKTILLAVVWHLPTRWMSLKARQLFITIWLILAKWALCDIFLLVFFDVAFRFHVSLSSAPYFKRLLPKDYVTGDLVVKPELPSYLFITATIVVVFCINMAEYYHKNDLALKQSQGKRGFEQVKDLNYAPAGWFKRIRCARGSWFERGSEEFEVGKRVNPDFDPYAKASIVSHRFTKNPNIKDPLVIRCLLRSNEKLPVIWYSILLFLLVGATVVIGYGATIDSFSFRFKALAGQALAFLDPGSEVREYSVTKLIGDLSIHSVVLDDESLTPSLFWGVTYMQTVTILFAIVLPLLQIALLIAMLIAKLNLRDQKILFYIASLVSSLSCLDVFAVSIIAAVSQLETFSLFLQGQKCDFIIDHWHTDCFRVTTELLPGCWLLFFAAVFLFVTSRIVFSLLGKVIKDRESKALLASGIFASGDELSTMSDDNNSVSVGEDASYIHLEEDDYHLL